MTDRRLILIYERDPLIGEDLQEMLAQDRHNHCVLFGDLDDMLTAVCKPECQPDVVFLAYEPARPQMEEALGHIFGTGARLVLVDGLAARASQAQTRSWFALSKPFNQADVDAILADIFRPRGLSAAPDLQPAP
ncbi:hypothetical protein [Oceanibium sediminis]|uniref:hypothetical protein n=1 Tax=Oceanibium sediminis TaxID=2026339 RepID=UPI000DD3572D|nr:hypothetical protein [Oceanibium sediminis]